VEHGAVSVTQTFTPGEYRVFVNGAPAGGEPVGVSAPLHVPGKAPVPKAMGVDADRPRTVGNVTATLDGYKNLRAGREATLTFRLERDGKPAADLKPQSGASDHLTAVSQDLKQCLHAEPAQASTAAAPAFAVRFDRPGLYRVWGEFPSGERTLLFPFVVEVNGADEK
jgi:hypothetical protein